MSTLSAELLDRASSAELAIRDEAREQIISLGSIEGFYECVNFARARKDSEALEFWLVEIVTSRSETETLAKAIIELTQEVLDPQNRICESLVYLNYIARATSGLLEDQLHRLIEKMNQKLDESSHVRTSSSWKDVDLTEPLKTGASDQEHYDRFRAYFNAVAEEKMAPLLEDMRVDYLPKIFGYFIGLRSSLLEKGVSSELGIKAFVDFQKSEFPNFLPGLPRSSRINAVSSGLSQQLPKSTQATKKQNLSSYGVSKKVSGEDSKNLSHD